MRILRIGLKYITNTSKMVMGDIKQLRNLPIDVTTAAKQGWQTSRTTHGVIRSSLDATKEVAQRGLKPHLPGLLAGMSYVPPLTFVPGSSIACYGVGKALQHII